jgi:tetratricopeptide (TPR) repeat protein
MVHYASGRYVQAAEWFSKALIANPHCDPSLRTSIGLCYYKMLQFERASQSALRAISLDCMDSTALILMGLADLSEADKNHSKRKDLRRSAFDCFSLANRLDPTNPVIWNLLANQYYHSWFPFECITLSSFIGNDTVVVNVRAPNSVFVAGNALRFGSHKDSFLIKEVVEYPSEENDGSQVFKIVLDGLVPSRILSSESFCKVMINNLILATSLVETSLKNGLSEQVKAESHFILGKIRHHQRNLLGAMESYKAALKEKADFALAAFGLAEIQFVRMEYKHSLEIFEKILQQHPTDKDTQAYVSLLKGMLKNEQTPMDKLKEVAINFQLDLELWKVQGFVRHNHSGRDSLEDALRCYQNCLDCYQSRGLKPSPEVLNNVAQIFFLLGKPEKSIRFIKEAISLLSEGETQPLPASFSLETDFENLAYMWEETNVQLLGCISGFDGSFTVEAGELSNCVLAPGSEIMIGDVIVEIDEVKEDSITCRGISYSETSGSVSSRLRVKKIVNCFGTSTLNYWFNLGTYLEATRMFRSARLIYETILSFYPSFDECNVRIASIYRSVGNLEGALRVLNALTGISHSREINIIKGDVLLAMGRPEEAKRSYEANVDKNSTAKDQALFLSLGNLYMNAHDPKISYKYYYGLLQEHEKNIYAANGLGIACVKKGEFESAKQIFHKIRQFAMGSDEKMFSLNLAHTALMECKYLEAERLYLAAYKDDSRWSDRDGRCSYANLEHAGCASFLSNRLEDATKFCLRAMHANLSKQTLANSSIVLERYIAHSSRHTDHSPVLVDLVRFCRQFLKAGVLENKSSKNAFADRMKIMETLYMKLTSRQENRGSEESAERILGKRKFEE